MNREGKIIARYLSQCFTHEKIKEKEKKRGKMIFSMFYTVYTKISKYLNLRFQVF